MLDIKFIRENPDLVKENIKKKFQDDKLPMVDTLLKADEEYRAILKKSENLRHERNKITSEINEGKKAGKDVSALLEQAKNILLDPEFENYTIAAIGLECGFNSKSTFYAAFKKFTSLSPSAFKKGGAD